MWGCEGVGVYMGVLRSVVGVVVMPSRMEGSECVAADLPASSWHADRASLAGESHRNKL